jgi:hypothetical protein
MIAICSKTPRLSMLNMAEDILRNLPANFLYKSREGMVKR